MVAHPLVGLAEVAVAQGHPDDAITWGERALALREANQVAPGELARAAFVLARALSERDRPRAISLAEAARELPGGGTRRSKGPAIRRALARAGSRAAVSQ
jgi:hypothetical protein